MMNNNKSMILESEIEQISMRANEQENIIKQKQTMIDQLLKQNTILQDFSNNLLETINRHELEKKDLYEEIRLLNIALAGNGNCK